jgi:hypothetical protein
VDEQDLRAVRGAPADRLAVQRRERPRGGCRAEDDKLRPRKPRIVRLELDGDLAEAGSRGRSGPASAAPEGRGDGERQKEGNKAAGIHATHLRGRPRTVASAIRRDRTAHDCARQWDGVLQRLITLAVPFSVEPSRRRAPNLPRFHIPLMECLMAPDSGAGGDVDARIRRLEEKFDQLQAAQGSLKSTGRIMTVILVIVVLFCGYRLVTPLIDIAQNPKGLMDKLSADIQASVFPRLQAEGEALVKEDLLPFAEKELKAHIEKRIPELQAKLESEGTLLVADMTTLLETKVKERAINFQERYLEVFENRFPDLADEQKAATIMANLQLALDNVGERILSDYLREHREAIGRMAGSFDKLPVPNSIKAMTNTELLDHTLAKMAEVLATRFELAPELTVGAPASAK